MGLFGRKKKEESDFPLLADDLPPLPALPRESSAPRMREDFQEHRPFTPAPPINKLSLPEPAREIPREQNNFLPPMNDMKPAPLPEMPKLRLPEQEKHSVPEFDMPPVRSAERSPASNVSFKGSVESSKANVFVKLEKYNEILKTLDSLEGRVKELDSMISKIQDARMKERELIAKWTELLVSTKNEISKITRTLPTT